MIEADVWEAILAVINTGIIANGLADIEVIQAFQPTKQGPPDKNNVRLFKISAPRVGHQGRNAVFNVGNDNFDETEKYWQSINIQATTEVRQDLSDEDSLTAYDLAGLCAAILQTRVTRQALLVSGISIENIKDIRFSSDLDDSDEYDLNPSFDFTVLYEQTLSSNFPKVHHIDANIKRV